MTTVPRPSGTVTVPTTGRVVCAGGGSLVCSLPLQDYIPPQPQNLADWIDLSTGTTGSSSVVRATTVAVDMDVDGEGGTPRAAPGTNDRALTLRRRRVDGSLIAAAPVAAVTAGTVYQVGRQNGAPVLALGPTSAGLATTWGPIPAATTSAPRAAGDVPWTIAVFVRSDRLVDTYNGVPGAGPMTLVASGAAGSPSRITVDLPHGGAVPPAAVRTGGGPLDGVVPGVPLDVACYNQWRLVALRNDPAAADGCRTVLLDGYPVATAGPTTAFGVAEGTPVVVGAGCTASIAEVLAWGAVVSDAELVLHALALRVKWNVPTLPSAYQGGTLTLQPTTGVVLTATTSPAARAVGFAVPTACWLDASCVGTLFADAAGTQPAGSGGPVALWRDSGNHGRHLAFPAAAPARWVTETVNRLGGRPVVATADGGAGTFAEPPLASGGTQGGFAVVAVWRVLARPAGSLRPNGHPLSGGPDACFDLAAWCEGLGVAQPRALPAPAAALGLAAGDAVVGCWERSASGAVVWRLNNLSGGGGGVVWSGAVDDDVTFAAALPAGVGANLQLAELMVWRNYTLSGADRDGLTAYLAGRWGVALSAATSGATTHAVPAAFPAPTGGWLDATRADTLFANAALTTPVPAVGGAVLGWRDRGNNGHDVAFPAGAAAATWGADAAGRAMVTTAADGGAGAFAVAPWGAGGTTGGFMAVAVWGVLARPGGALSSTPNGHPLACGSAPCFDLASWVEQLGVATAVPVPTAPSALGVAAGDTVVGCWEQSPGGTVTWRLNNLQVGTTSGGGGFVWTGDSADATFATRPAGVGANLRLRELLVWRNAVLSAAERAALAAYLGTRWGVALPTTGLVSAPLPQPVPTAFMSLLVIAGGGGRGADAGTGKNPIYCGGSGGAGEVFELLNLPVTPGSTLVTMTLGGAGLNYNAVNYLVSWAYWTSGRDGEDTEVVLNNQTTYVAKGGGGGGNGNVVQTWSVGYPGRNGGSGGGAGNGCPTPGLSIAAQRQQDGFVGTGSTSWGGCGGGAAPAGATTEQGLGRTSAFMNSLLGVTGTNQTSPGFSLGTPGLTGQPIALFEQLGADSYTAGSSNAALNTAPAGNGNGWGKGAGRYVAQNGAVVLVSTVPATSNNAFRVANANGLYYYLWTGYDSASKPNVFRQTGSIAF